jgi:hypothetical protein
VAQTPDAWLTDRRLIAAVLDQPAPAGPDLLAALALVPGLRRDLDRVERALIGAAREGDVSWGEVAAALRLRSRQAAEQRWLRLTSSDAGRDAVTARRRRRHQRIVDTSAGPAVVALRAAVRTLVERIEGVPDRGGRAPAATLALRTLQIALNAEPGALFDLARLAIADLATVGTGTLAEPVRAAVRRVEKLLAEAKVDAR